MKKYAMFIMAVFAAAIFFASCEEEENQTINDPYQRIEGKWDLEKYVQRGDPMIELDGSIWKFKLNDSTEAPFTGIDSLTSYYESSGMFEYAFSENEDTLKVFDQNQNGGYHNGNWLIQEFKDKALLLTREYDDTEYGDTLQFSRN